MPSVPNLLAFDRADELVVKHLARLALVRACEKSVASLMERRYQYERSEPSSVCTGNVVAAGAAELKKASIYL